MIYMTNEARESAQESITELIEKIAMGEKFDYTDSVRLINHLRDLKMAIEQEKTK